MVKELCEEERSGNDSHRVFPLLKGSRVTQVPTAWCFRDRQQDSETEVKYGRQWQLGVMTKQATLYPRNR